MDQEQVKNWTPVTYENCERVSGPFYHGTKAKLSKGDLLTTGYVSHFEEGLLLNHVYFAALLEPAIWGAELAVSLSKGEYKGRIYIVEPTGPFEDDPNLTNKKFPGNPTQSYRSSEPLRVIEEVEDWEPHSDEALQAMLDSLADLKRRGLAVIEN